ncbi:MAG: hypothetical protein KBO60_14550, partial [Achromobacter sp.]|nr:hypothetical protein [Achromobacter sp.]
MFPELIPARQVRGAIDGFVDHLVTNYADTLEKMSQPVLHALVWLEQLLRSARKAGREVRVGLRLGRGESRAEELARFPGRGLRRHGAGLRRARRRTAG